MGEGGGGGCFLCMEEQHPLLVRGPLTLERPECGEPTKLWKILGWHIHYRLRINTRFLMLITHDVTETYLTSYH